jgi:predicted nucleotidyltransferase
MGPDEADDESLVQIEEVCEEGIHIALDDGDVFLPFAWFPVIANAPVSRIFDVRIRRPGHLFWPSLDFEVPIASLPPWTVQYAVRAAVGEGSVREAPAVEGPLRIAVPHDAVARFCQERGIRRLSFFGSVTRDDFTPGSDVDVLVEFLPERTPSLFKMVSYQDELSGLLGRQVDLHTFKGLNKYIRDEVLAEAVDEYVAP